MSKKNEGNKEIEVKGISKTDIEREESFLSFHSIDGVELGKLLLLEDGLVFTGNASESAKILVDNILVIFEDKINSIVANRLVKTGE